MNQPVPEERTLDRRGFIGWIIAAIYAVLGMILGLPIIGYILSPIFKIKKDLSLSTQWAPVAPLSEIETVGHFPKKFEVPYRVREGWRFRETSRAVFAVKEGERLVILSSFCTHLGCPTFWDKENREIICPCHGGLYNNLGQVIGGPPPRDLPRLNYKIEEGIVYLEQPGASDQIMT